MQKMMFSVGFVVYRFDIDQIDCVGPSNRLTPRASRLGVGTGCSRKLARYYSVIANSVSILG